MGAPQSNECLVRFSVGLRPLLRVMVWALRAALDLSVQCLLLLRESWMAACVYVLLCEHGVCLRVVLMWEYVVLW